MAKLINQFDLSNVRTWEELRRFTSIMFQDIYAAFNGNIEFNENLKTSLLDVTFSAANTNTSFPHTFGKVPNGYIVVGAEQAGNLYDGTTSNTSSTIYLRASAIGSYRVIIF